jgi:hypothetical protein
MHWCLTIRIQPKGGYENILIYYIINVVNLHVSVTFVAHFKEVYFAAYITNTTKPTHIYKILSFKYVNYNVYILKYNTYKIICAKLHG